MTYVDGVRPRAHIRLLRLVQRAAQTDLDFPLADRDSTVTSVTCPACKSSAPYKSVHDALDAAKLAFADAEKAQYTGALDRRFRPQLIASR